MTMLKFGGSMPTVSSPNFSAANALLQSGLGNLTGSIQDVEQNRINAYKQQQAENLAKEQMFINSLKDMAAYQGAGDRFSQESLLNNFTPEQALKIQQQYQAAKDPLVNKELGDIVARGIMGLKGVAQQQNPFTGVEDTKKSLSLDEQNRNTSMLYKNLMDSLSARATELGATNKIGTYLDQLQQGYGSALKLDPLQQKQYDTALQDLNAEYTFKKGQEEAALNQAKAQYTNAGGNPNAFSIAGFDSALSGINDAGKAIGKLEEDGFFSGWFTASDREEAADALKQAVSTGYSGVGKVSLPVAAAALDFMANSGKKFSEDNYKSALEIMQNANTEYQNQSAKNREGLRTAQETYNRNMYALSRAKNAKQGALEGNIRTGRFGGDNSIAYAREAIIPKPTTIVKKKSTASTSLSEANKVDIKQQKNNPTQVLDNSLIQYKDPKKTSIIEEYTPSTFGIPTRTEGFGGEGSLVNDTQKIITSPIRGLIDLGNLASKGTDRLISDIENTPARAAITNSVREAIATGKISKGEESKDFAKWLLNETRQGINKGTSLDELLNRYKGDSKISLDNMIPSEKGKLRDFARNDPTKLAKQLNISKEDANRIIKEAINKYHSIQGN